MTRHSFIQMSKLSNVKGRISYITSHARQENLYATYHTADNDFWSDLAKECQQEFKRSGADGKCIEARELIIALPEVYTAYEPQQVLEDFTEEFRKRYNVECVSALHHNKKKTNYHIHLIFSERRLLAEPDIKIATRSVFYDETGKRVRTKKEIADENGKIRVGCTVIPKGGVYEQHLFTVKDDRFKSEQFLDEVKRNYTDLINRHISDPEQRLKVFDPDSIYLPTKKIGKNNPKAAEIEADNAARQEWNRTADMALISGIEETKILEIKKEEIHQKASQSIRTNGWLPNLFRSIVSKAKEFLQNLIRQTALPPKPILSMDMAEFRTMQKLMIRVQDRAKEIRSLQDEVPKLKAQLAETKGIFKSRERKALEAQMLFDRQYILTEDVVVEQRYYLETDTWTDEDGNTHSDTYRVYYDYYICTVTLENFNLSHLPVYIMGEETLSRYALYMATLGNRPDLFPSSPYVGKYTNKPPAHEIPADYLADETFAAILKEAEKYVGYPYVWGGSSPSTSFDCSGFVSYVYNQCGWDFGRLGAQGLYNISTRTSSPKPGDLVFFTGTYDTPGISHVGIYVGDGWMLHCGDPISYANLNTSYWQSHFYAYGKLF